MGASVEIRCVRGMMYAGRALEVGEVVGVAPLAAADLLTSGRCVLVDPAEAEHVNSAAKAESDRMLKKLDQAERQRAVAG